ncbi:ImmA/IrrE family metallo-endopeptidase [Kitasatospora sp. NBC_01250]|uniref:ImmA/IrrE family metallo-endopeptidase n=1 Tax=Kitasatospora sp. NBC_01250 TaxID=2903571 RepID=UPI002E2F65EA|nr:ImmA/IrrE family metallo-endopeptidase [Kitasatospora sp. NBC_01250]
MDEDDDGPAVLLNADLDVITQRHTAAHELGHHRLGHRSAADDNLDPSARWGDRSWPDHEKVAEAFAAWFLMPRPAVLRAVKQVAGGAGPSRPEHVYLVARALGTSYAGTVRHLARLRLLTHEQADRWHGIAPSALKSSLCGGRNVPSGSHVHAVGTPCHGRRVYADTGDLLVLLMPGAHFDPPPPGLALWTGGAPGDGQGKGLPHKWQTLQVTEDLDGSATVTVNIADSDDPFGLAVTRQSPRTGSDDIWPT